MLRMNNEQSARLKKLMKKYAAVTVIGIAYLIWVLLTDLRIPCFFYVITDKYCPGCGVTRMCIDIARFDFKAAISHNVLVFCLLPVIFGFLVFKSVQYVKSGNIKDSIAEKVIYMIGFLLCIVFWVMRNMPRFLYLAP